MPQDVIAHEDPHAPDVLGLLELHHAFANTHSPPEDVHALDPDRLAQDDIAFFGLRRDGVLLAVGALQELDATHGEIKSMHTAEIARGQGAGRAVLEHLLRLAAERGYRRVSLETGTQEAFAPARALYERLGFTPCAPFGHYRESPNSRHMTLELPA